MGICSLSIASPTIAYTSAHCFDEDKNDVGTKVYTDDGRLVGIIRGEGGGNLVMFIPIDNMEELFALG